MTSYTPLLQEKAHYVLSETNGLVSRLRKGREKMRHFLESALLSTIFLFINRQPVPSERHKTYAR